MSQLMHLSVISSAMITYQLGYGYPDLHLSYASTDRIPDPCLLEPGQIQSTSYLLRLQLILTYGFPSLLA